MNIKDLPTPELINELTARCNPAIFMGSKNESMDDNGRMTFFEYKGHPAVCYGLCHEMAFTILTDQARKI